MMAMAIRPISSTSSMGDVALDYVHRGWSVIPLHTPNERGMCSCGRPNCTSPGKHPVGELVKDGLKGASKDPIQVARWWAQRPNANVGIVCGAVSGLVVLDVDGPDGAESLEGLERELGALPETVEALTGKGRHLYYRYPGGRVKPSAGLLGRGLDVRGDDSYVVGPGSLHHTGRRYEWEVTHGPADLAIAQLPAAWVQRLQQSKPRPTQGTTDMIPQGERNSRLAQMAGAMRRHGADFDAILAALLIANQKQCDPPLEETEVRQIAQSVARYEPAPLKVVKPAAAGEPLEIRETDLGNARRLVRRYGNDLRYCHTWHKWLVWDGTRWAIDDVGAVERMAKATVHEIYNEAAAEQLDERRQALVKHALRSESMAKISAMITLAASEPAIPIKPEALDIDPWLLNCSNGTVDLRTGAFKPHDRADLITRVIPIAYDPEAPCPKWEAFLEQIFDGNEDLIGFVQRAVGYSLTGVADERCMFILYGTGRNGKSTFIETIADMMDAYAMQTEAETLLVKKDQAAVNNDVARLRGARLVYTGESDDGRALAEGKIKRLTGQDTVSARFLYSETFDFKPVFKLWFATNHKPTIRGTDDGIWDRIRLIPFTVRIPDHKVRPRSELAAEFGAEMPGILAWAVRGCLEWKKHGLGMPEAVREATAGYRAEMDILAAFLDECCIVDKSMSATAKSLYTAYTVWCRSNGEKEQTQRWFGGRLSERGFERSRGTGGYYLWSGLAVRPELLQPEVPGVKN